MQLQVGVKILLKNKAGKFLLVRRNPKKYPEVGAEWDIVGGRIEPGSSLIDNLKREVMEETGLELRSQVTLVAAQDIFPQDRHVVRLTYVGSIDGEPKIDEEHTEFQWFTSAEIKGLKNLDKYFKELIENKIIEL
jgi:ADP-ribose pyrophosphatase YjhB (NUDIX family)